MAKFAALRSTQQRGRGVAVRRAAKPAQATVRRPSKPQPALAQAEGQRVEFLSLMRRYDQCAEKVEAARGEMREMLADAKIAGFKGAWFRLARLLRGESEALATRVRNEVDDRLKIGKWVGDTRLTVQFDLVANAVAVPIAADPYQEGRQAEAARKVRSSGPAEVAHGLSRGHRRAGAGQHQADGRGAGHAGGAAQWAGRRR